MTSPITITARRTDLGSLREILETQRVRRLDVIAPAHTLSFVNGTLIVPDTNEPLVTEDGVTQTGGQYDCLGTFDDLLAYRLNIPTAYVRWLREHRLDLFDANANALLHGLQGDPIYADAPADDRKFMIRLFRGDDDGRGVARGIMSDSFKPVDNLDVLVAAFAGIREAGMGIDPDLPGDKRITISRCDLTERNMYVAIDAPSIRALAPELLKGYRNPRTGLSADADPSISAGIVIMNSELGGGAVKVVPRITVLACSNGMTFTKDAFRAIHAGSKREEGIVRYSDDTMRKELELITAKVRDAVGTYLDADYVMTKVREMERLAGVEVTKPEETIKAVVSEAGFPKGMEDDIFAAFIKGGQCTAGGVMQAVTYVAQDVESADTAYDMEDKAQRVLEIAARRA